MERTEGMRRSCRLLCLTAATLTILTGCAGRWWLFDGADAQFRRDAMACERDAALQSPTPRTVPTAPVGFVHPRADYTMGPGGLPNQLGTETGTRAHRARLVDSCMEAKGHRPDSRYAER